MKEVFSKPGFTSQLHAKNGVARQKHKNAVALATATHGPPGPNDLVPDLIIEKRAVADLKPAKRRIRKTPPEQQARVIASVKAHGFVLPVLIDDQCSVIHGHALVEAAKQLGIRVRTR